jgi:hypothetical protein
MKLTDILLDLFKSLGIPLHAMPVVGSLIMWL